MMRTRLNLRIVLPWSIQLISGVREKTIMKNQDNLYPEPAQVPLGE